MKDVFCREASRQIEDLVIDNLVELAPEWQCRPLETFCVLVFMDAAFLRRRDLRSESFPWRMGIILTVPMGNVLTARVGKVLDIYSDTESLKYWAPDLPAMIYSR